MDYEEKVKFNNKVKIIAWAMYLIFVALLIIGVAYFGIKTRFLKGANLSNPFFYIMMAIMGIAYALHRFAMIKITENASARFYCSICDASLEVKEVKITPKHGFMYEQKCPRCGRMMTPDIRSLKK